MVKNFLGRKYKILKKQNDENFSTNDYNQPAVFFL